MDRQCGDCQLCCKLLPVRTLGKAAGQRCKHQRHHKGLAESGLSPYMLPVWQQRAIWLRSP
jgi:hypothetical protein